MELHTMLLAKQIKITRIMNAVAAGTTDQTSTAINQAGFDGCLIIAGFGALTATQQTLLKVQQSSDDGSADAYSDIEGSGTNLLEDTDGNKLLAVDIFRPEKQYLKGIVDRGNANAVIDFMIAIQYAGREIPITQGATLKELVSLVTPPEGTA